MAAAYWISPKPAVPRSRAAHMLTPRCMRARQTLPPMIQPALAAGVHLDMLMGTTDPTEWEPGCRGPSE